MEIYCEFDLLMPRDFPDEIVFHRNISLFFSALQIVQVLRTEHQQINERRSKECFFFIPWFVLAFLF